MSAAPPPSLATPTRAIVLLAFAAFASQGMVRVTDSVLPQIAADLGTSVGAASIVVSAYAITHGSVQLVGGAFGDRMGKYRTVAIACALSAVFVLLCGFAQNLTQLALARLASGVAAALIIPLSMAFVGDAVPYDQRQGILGRYLSGQILGQLFGQAAGGVLGDLFGWRAVFFILAALFGIAALALLLELALDPTTRQRADSGGARRSLLADYRLVFGDPWARTILLAVGIEGALAYGVFTFVGAELRLRFGLSYTAIGLIVASFAVGGLIYALTVRQLLRLFGESGLARNGAFLFSAGYLALALSPVWQSAPLVVAALGLGFYMLHNTLQTHATQMAPEARGTALSVFAAAIYAGTTVGATLGALVWERLGGRVLFGLAAVLIALLGVWVSRRIAVRRTR